MVRAYRLFIREEVFLTPNIYEVNVKGNITDPKKLLILVSSQRQPASGQRRLSGTGEDTINTEGSMG